MSNIEKRALITGITGYIGSNLARNLIESGWKVGGIIKNNSSMDAIEDICDEIQVCVYDGEIDSLLDFFDNFCPTVVFHLASCFIAEHRSNQVTDLVQSNLLFGTHILEAMAKAGVDKLVNTSTSWQHYNNDTYNPVCLYAATKEAFEKIICFYVEAYDFKVITLELFDTYGPNDPRRKLINLFYKYAQTSELLEMSYGEQEIDLVYIDDVVLAYINAYLLLLREGSIFEKYSVCTGQPMNLREIAKIFEDVCQKKLNIVWGKKAYRKREVMNVWSNGCILPNWRALYNLESGIRKIFALQAGGRND